MKREKKKEISYWIRYHFVRFHLLFISFVLLLLLSSSLIRWYWWMHCVATTRPPSSSIYTRFLHIIFSIHSSAFIIVAACLKSVVRFSLSNKLARKKRHSDYWTKNKKMTLELKKKKKKEQKTVHTFRCFDWMSKWNSLNVVVVAVASGHISNVCVHFITAHDDLFYLFFSLFSIFVRIPYPICQRFSSFLLTFFPSFHSMTLHWTKNYNWIAFIILTLFSVCCALHQFRTSATDNEWNFF